MLVLFSYQKLVNNFLFTVKSLQKKIYNIKKGFKGSMLIIICDFGLFN